MERRWDKLILRSTAPPLYVGQPPADVPADLSREPNVFIGLRLSELLPITISFYRAYSSHIEQYYYFILTDGTMVMRE